MRLHLLEREQRLAISPSQAWEFFSSPVNLAEITPPDLDFQIRECDAGSIHEGQILSYRVRIFPGVRLTWVTEIKGVDAPHSFIDEQRAGPYRFWNHRHSFHPIPGGIMMHDRVLYALPFGPFGILAHRFLVRRKLERIFDFRARTLVARFGGL